MKFGNLLIAGIATGSIYALFAACITVWFRVSNVLNLAIGDFAMVGAMGAADLVQKEHLNNALAIIVAILITGALAWVFDRIVLHIALDIGHGVSGLVSVFFYMFAFSLLIEGAAKVLFGTNVHAAPLIWGGPAFSIDSLHIQRAALIVIAVALLSGLILVAYLHFTVSGKAASASGESVTGSRVVGIDRPFLRRWILVGTAIVAALLGIAQSPLTGFVYNSGASIGLIGVVAAGCAGLRRPGRAVLIGLGIGVLESLIGGYISTLYNDVILYSCLVLLFVFWPGVTELSVAT